MKWKTISDLKWYKHKLDTLYINFETEKVRGREEINPLKSQVQKRVMVQ